MKLKWSTRFFCCWRDSLTLIQIGLCCPSFFRHETSLTFSQMQIASDVPLWTQKTYGHVPEEPNGKSVCGLSYMPFWKAGCSSSAATCTHGEPCRFLRRSSSSATYESVVPFMELSCGIFPLVRWPSENRDHNEPLMAVSIECLDSAIRVRQDRNSPRRLSARSFCGHD